MIEKIPHYSLTNPGTVYDEEAMTALELAGRTTAKVNECIEQVNKNTVDMPGMVDREVQDHINNGDFTAQMDAHNAAILAQIEESEKTMRAELDAAETSLGNRVDNLLGSVQQGGTTMDAEVIDIRQGENGKTYPNAGQAVRLQLAALKKDAALLDSKVGMSGNAILDECCTAGKYYYSGDGKLYEGADMSTSEFIPCGHNEDWACRCIGHVTVWDANRDFLTGYSCDDSNNYFVTFNTGENGAYICVGFHNTNIHILNQTNEDREAHEGMLTLAGTALDGGQMQRKRFVEMLMEYKHPIPVSWMMGGLDAVGNYVEGITNSVTDFFTVPTHATEFHVETIGEHFTVGYDENKVGIWSTNAWVNDETIKNTATYYRVYTTLASTPNSYNVVEAEKTAKIYFYNLPNNKRPYQNGYIYFTVDVNQHITDLSNTSNMIVDAENNVSVDCALKLPATYSPNGKPCKLLMICHGASRGVTGDEPWPEMGSYNAMVDGFIKAGYAVFDCNGYANDFMGMHFWGAPRGVEAWRKAYDYITRHYNVEHGLNVYGFSMGGLTALNLMFSRFPHIKAVGVGAPVLDVTKEMFEHDTTVLTAYGMTNGWDESATVGSRPMQRIVTLDGTPMIMGPYPPVKMWFGKEDTETRVSYENGQAFIQALKNGGNLAYFRPVNDSGHELCYGANEAVNAELVMWFNRFN